MSTVQFVVVVVVVVVDADGITYQDVSKPRRKSRPTVNKGVYRHADNARIRADSRGHNL